MSATGKVILMMFGFTASLSCGQSATAQDMDAIFLKYTNEQAVITSVKEQLVIKNEKGRLVASSNVSTEKMLIGDMSPGLYNKEYIFHGYFNRLEDHDEEALIPNNKNGYTHRRDPGVKTTHSEDESVFYDDARQTEISFSGLTPKSLMRSNYTLSHMDLHMLPSFFFKENLRVLQTTYEVTAPKYVNMKFVIKGYETERIKQTKEEGKNTITYTFTATDVPAFKHYDDAPSSAWYALHVVPYIASYSMPGENKTEILGDLEHLYTYLYKFIREVNLTDDEELTKTLATIIKDDKTQREKSAHIYQWVQQNIHYIAFEDSLGSFIPRQAAAVCKRKFGDCKDMASIITALCRKAGIDAYFTWIGTRSKPYTWEETPLPKVANHMICTIKLDGEFIFLDGTHPLIPFGKIPSTIQGKEALVGISEKEFKIIKVPETDAKYNITTDTTFLKIAGNQASGNIITRLQGYPSWDMQTMMAYRSTTARDKLAKTMMGRGSNKFVQQNYQFIKSDAGDRDCKLTADFTIDDYVQKVGNEYIVNLNLKQYFGNNIIDTEGRQVPVYFGYKDIVREAIVLEVPAGYHVSYLPPEATGGLKDVWSYKLAYKKEGNKVILAREYIMYAMSVPKKSFIDHNKMVENLEREYKESVVLTAN